VAAASLAAAQGAWRYRQRRDRADWVAFAIETKTRTVDARQLTRVREMAAWLYRRRRRWCRRGALPVLCVVRASGLERVEDEVLIVSLDRLVAALRGAAGTSQPRVPSRRDVRELIARSINTAMPIAWLNDFTRHVGPQGRHTGDSPG
jgi:hypothetical protein